MSFADSLGNQAFLLELVAALASESKNFVFPISKDVKACCSAFCLLPVQFPSQEEVLIVHRLKRLCFEEEPQGVYS